MLLRSLNSVTQYKISGEDESSAGAARILITGTYCVVTPPTRCWRRVCIAHPLLLFVASSQLFGSLITTIWITAAHDGRDDHDAWWPFIANILSVFFILVSCSIMRFAPYAMGGSDSGSLW